MRWLQCFCFYSMTEPRHYIVEKGSVPRPWMVANSYMLSDLDQCHSLRHTLTGEVLPHSQISELVALGLILPAPRRCWQPSDLGLYFGPRSLRVIAVQNCSSVSLQD